MPTSSSESSEGTAARPARKRTTARKKTATASTRTTRTRKVADDVEVEEVVSRKLNDSADDFGDGVDSEEAPVRKPRKAVRKSTRKRTVEAEPDTTVDVKSDSDEAPSEGVRRRSIGRKPKSDSVSGGADDAPEAESKSAPRQMAFFSTDEIDFGDSDGDRPPAASGEDAGEDGDRRPRRRRRRRRRGPDRADRPVGDNGQVPRGGASIRQDPPGQRGRGGRRRGGRNDERPRRGPDNRPGRSGVGGPGMRRSRPVQASTEVIEGTFEGVLELHPKGYGFLRDPKKNYAAEDSNPFVSSSVVEKYQLREGVLVKGEVGQGSRNQGPRLKDVETIDGFTPEEFVNVKHFDELTPINPFEQIRLETGPRPITMRVMDLLCPIGKGQRALLVAPPRTGKTMLLQDIANSVSENHPEIHLMVLLIDERPEEVTEMRRYVNGEVISSSLDNDVESHIRISQLIIERGKRLAEEGKDVFILLDSITRLARAFNKWSNTGRTQTGGLDIRALDIPKKLFGTARRFDEGGSLTVCGTALIDTGSRMDEAIFQEFKGTGNMEMVLSRDLADRRIWPAIDIGRSGTRREEKILSPEVLDGTTMLRRSLISLSPVEAMEQLIKTMERFPTNAEFLQKIRAIL
ncbi:MAG: transcription termination factor Rho [Planctomycetaceae bacterium]